MFGIIFDSFKRALPGWWRSFQVRKGKAMTLGEFLTALSGNDIVITVSDADNDKIIKFYNGTTALDDTLEARTVKKITLAGASAINIFLNSAE